VLSSGSSFGWEAQSFVTNGQCGRCEFDSQAFSHQIQIRPIDDEPFTLKGYQVDNVCEPIDKCVKVEIDFGYNKLLVKLAVAKSTDGTILFGSDLLGDQRIPHG
jgi:hypothetical protein